MKLPASLFKTDCSQPSWNDLSFDELQKLSLKKVYLPLHRTGIRPFIEKLYFELEHKGLGKFRPHFWFSNEWFTPDGIGGIALPFYLAHKKLARLEERNLLEVEGGTPRWFMQLLRHECGHAIDNAYQLRRRKKRQQIFGKSFTWIPGTLKVIQMKILPKPLPFGLGLSPTGESDTQVGRR